MQTSAISTPHIHAEVRTVSSPSFIARHAWLVAVAGTLAFLSALFLRIEWLTPPLDALQPRSFGVALTIHGALAFYFVMLPLVFTIPVLMTLSALRRQVAPAWPRLSRLAWWLQAAGLAAIAALILRGGSEAGWNGAFVFGGTFEGAAWIGLAGLLAALSLVAQGVQIAGTALIGRESHPVLSTPRSAFVITGGLGAFAGATLALCMSSILADRIFGLTIFDPRQGGDPTLFDWAFSGFRSTALAMALLVPALLSLAVVSSSVRPSRDSISIPFLAALSLAVAIPLGGTIAALKWISAVSVFVMSAVAFLRVAREAKVSAGGLAVWSVFFLAGLQALAVALLAEWPAGAPLFRQTTLESAALHMVALAGAGLGLPTLALLSGRVSPNREFLLLAFALILFAGIQFMCIPDALAGMQGLSHRANSYPPEFQTLKVLGTAGSTILLVGLLGVFGVLANASPKPSEQ